MTEGDGMLGARACGRRRRGRGRTEHEGRDLLPRVELERLVRHGADFPVSLNRVIDLLVVYRRHVDEAFNTNNSNS